MIKISITSLEAFLLCSIVYFLKQQRTVFAGPNPANLRLMQMTDADKSSKHSIYPDYCWFIGLENRILLEYPQLHELIQQHHKRLYIDRDLRVATELHRKIFMEIYRFELDRRAIKFKRSNGRKHRAGRDFARIYRYDDNDDDNDGGDTHYKDRVNLQVNKKDAVTLLDRPKFKAAYKLFDLWANTPGDFEMRRGDFKNYLESYLIQSHIEFWSYCLDDPASCREILGQLIVLAREQELGPIELMQVSINIIKLMNSHKADLLLERLTDRRVIKQSAGESSLDLEAVSPLLHSPPLEQTIGIGDEEDDPDEAYERRLSDIVHLIETDDDFSEATFHYVFTKNDEVHKIIDDRVEAYLNDRITKASSEK